MFTQPLIIGSTYRLKFKTLFERHGVCTTPGVTCLHKGGGVFRLEQITNFRDLVLAGIKLYDVFFEPVGITAAEYQAYFNGKPSDTFEPEYTTTWVDNVDQSSETFTDTDGDLAVRDIKVNTKHEVLVETGRSILKKHYRDTISYASFPIYKFVDVIDSTDILWVPELTIAEFPEIDIREYRDLSLVVHLGYTHDPAVIDPMLLAIRERMAAYGWMPKHIKLYATDSKWMSPTEYDAIKNLRVPANIVTIDSDNYNQYLGEVAIVNGALKKIAKNITDPTTEVDIDTIAKHNVVIDNRLFMVKCKDGETFATGDNYYVQANRYSSVTFEEGESFDSSKTYYEKSGDTYTKTTDTTPDTSKTYYLNVACWKLLTEGIDYSPNDPCVTYRLATASESELQHYKKIDGTYQAVAYGHHGDYSADVLVRKISTDTYTATSDTEPSASKTYYIYASSTFRVATSSDFNTDGSFISGVTYYELESEGSISYRAATEEEIADPVQVLYVKTPDSYEKSNTGDYVRVFDGEDNTYTLVYRESYSTIKALSLIGFKFEYVDGFGQTKSMTIQLEDIIECGTDTSNAVLPAADQDYETFWKNYDGRKFRWVEYNDPKDSTLAETVETVISEDTVSIVAEKAGLILGQSGFVSKETYVKDSELQQRNYYMKYVIQSKQIADLKDRIAGLEKALVESNAQLAALQAS